MKFLLDTNIISEIRKRDRADASVAPPLLGAGPLLASSSGPILVPGSLGGLLCPLGAAARLCIDRDGPKSNALRAMAMRVSAARP